MCRVVCINHIDRFGLVLYCIVPGCGLCVSVSVWLGVYRVYRVYMVHIVYMLLGLQKAGSRLG